MPVPRSQNAGTARRPSVQPPAVSASPNSARWEAPSTNASTPKRSLGRASNLLLNKPKSNHSIKSTASTTSVGPAEPLPKKELPIASSFAPKADNSTTTVPSSNTTSGNNTSSFRKTSNKSLDTRLTATTTSSTPANPDSVSADVDNDNNDGDWISIPAPEREDRAGPPSALAHVPRPTDKASRILGIQHRQSMEPIPASARTSVVSTRSAPPPTTLPAATSPLTSLYVVSGLPKSPHTWTLADPDAVLGLHHAEGAVSRWWRPEVLGSTVSPGAGGKTAPRRKGKNKGDADMLKGAGALTKQEVGKMLSKALKLSFTREVEIIASTLQPASTVHTFTFALPAPNTPLAPTPSGDLFRASVFSASDHRGSGASFPYPYESLTPRPSTTHLGPPSLLAAPAPRANPTHAGQPASDGAVTYHGVCLTVWSHADAERSAAIRRTLEAGNARTRRESSLRRAPRRGPWTSATTDAETDAETEGEGGVSESDMEVASTAGHGPGESTLFLPGDTVFWLPYALTLVSRHPVYDLMRDYLTLSWARFSKDVQSHTLQISKILAHPAPRAGELVRLDASATSSHGSAETSLEVIARFPGGLDFGRGLVDINFTMWPLFKCLNIDNILTICEVALAPTGRVLFFSRHPALLGIAVATIKYLVELRGWSGIALSAVHSRDAKIYVDDPGPWIMGLATEARYSVRPSPEVCICDLDINYVSCPSPPVGAVSTKQQREKYRQRLLAAFGEHYHPDHCVPSEFKEAFPAGRFRPVCKIQAKRGASSAAVADSIKAPEWWHSTRIIQAFDGVLQDKLKKPSLFKRITGGAPKRPPRLTDAEQLIQLSIRKRASAFVDARDDLETKIGRLSRRLNFLMTESDLWRDKFVTFEQYAEKLSAEAGQLRQKIGKEQRETKRLSGLVTLTASEKAKLQNQLRDTEDAHRNAMVELEQMREAMEKMEAEREAMVAEVEAQIERALASMAVDAEDSDYGNDSSRPNSRMSGSSARAGRSRRASDAARPSSRLRSIGTESTLAESYEGTREETLVGHRETGTIEEGDEEEPVSPKKKRFSASVDDEVPQDGMSAVDEGITQKSDRIAQKVLQIQQKLENALTDPRVAARSRPGTATDPGSETDATHSQNRPPRPKGARQTSYTRSRSGTASSTQSNDTVASQYSDEGTASPQVAAQDLPVIPSEPRTPTAAQHTDTEPRSEERTTPHLHRLRKVRSNASAPGASPSSEATPSTPALTPGGVSVTTDDSDTDFQSAYSASPRGSYGSFGSDQSKESQDGDVPPRFVENGLPREEFGKHSVRDVTKGSRRERISSQATARLASQPSPTLSDETVISRSRARA